MGVSSEIAKIKRMTHFIAHTKTRANSCKTQNSTYVLHLGGNDLIWRKPKPRSLYEMTFARARFSPLRFSLQVRVRMRSRDRSLVWEVFGSSAIFGAATIDCTWQSASRHGVKKALKHREPEDAAKMSESGNQESAATPDDTRRPPRPSVGNKVTVVLGAQWGDEGKGKVVDLLAQDADMVCRCQVG